MIELGPGDWKVVLGTLFKKCSSCDEWLPMDEETGQPLKPHECAWQRNLRLAHEAPILAARVQELEAVLESVYNGLMPDGTLPGPVFAQVMRALGKGT
jgi:hypothetical protein